MIRLHEKKLENDSYYNSLYSFELTNMQESINVESASN